MPEQSILLLDSDAHRRKLKSFGLSCAGFSVQETSDVHSARLQLAQHCPRLLLVCADQFNLEVRDFVRSLRCDPYRNDLSVLIFLEHDGGFDAASAVYWGVDDCLHPPISPQEFVARVRACIERKAFSSAFNAEIAGLSLDCERGIVRRGAQVVALGPTERRLLECLLMHPGKIIPRDLLLFRIWGGGVSRRSRVVDVSICRLRRAFRKLRCEHLVQTVSRRGYRFAGRTGRETS